MNSTTLRTAAEIVTRHFAAEVAAAARQQREETKRTEWARRLDVSAYSCTRDGDVWIATGPAGQRFEFRKSLDGVQCNSHTGSEYHLHRDEERGWVCSCPTPDEKRVDGCKHEVGFRAICLAAQMEREARDEERQREAEEIRRDQPADEEEIDRRFRERIATQREMDRFPRKVVPGFAGL